MEKNKLPKYFMFAFIAVKFTTIYDKLRQLVAINQIYYQMIQEETLNLKDFIKDENLLKDILARREIIKTNFD